MRRRVYRGEYGPVEVVNGEHAGKVGLYDDDDFDEEGRDRAVVYFETPFEGPYYVIPVSWLRHTDVHHLPSEDWMRENRELAAYMGFDHTPRLAG